jgi:hypothetical protein
MMTAQDHLMEAEKLAWRVYAETATRVRHCPNPSNEDWVLLDRHRKEWFTVHDALQSLMTEGRG